MPHLGCPCRCSFCNQHVITGQLRPPGPKQVHETVRQARERIRREPQSVQIAFFGGSFTAIGRDYMLSLLQAAQEEVRRLHLGGIRVSTRPDAVDAQVLAELKTYGVTAVELGAQSMDDGVLNLNRRGHTAAQVETAARLIRESGLELGLQMMTGLCGDTDEKALTTAQRLIACRPRTIRIYPALLFRDTYLYELWEKGAYAPQTLEEAVGLCARLIPLFEEAGVSVIRVGLHAETEMQAQCAGGPFHPALKELCLSRIFYQKLRAALCRNLAESGAVRYTVKVHPQTVSVALGQKRANAAALAQEGFRLHFEQDPAVPAGSFLLLPS